MDDRSAEKLAYRVDDACRLLGIGRTSLYKLIAGGQLKTVRIAGRRLIPREEAAALLAKASQAEAAR
jgi:excisionase family DNA binding protein